MTIFSGIAGLPISLYRYITMRKPLHHHLLDYFFPHRRNNHRPNIFSAMSVLFIILAIGIFETGYLVQTKIVFLKTDFLASVLPGALVALTNHDRAASGIGGVTEDQLLSKAAQAAAEDMAAKGYFAHVSPDGKSPWYWLDSVGYQYSYAGENLAVNFTDSSEVETAWMNSPTHRANIEKPQYTKVGIGTANGIYEGADTTFVVQFFATPAATERTAPARVALAVPVEVKPPQSPVLAEASLPQIQASTTPANVLGTEVTTVAVPATRSIGWLESLLASPFKTLMTILYSLFVVIALSFIIAVVVRGKNQHPSVLVGGTILLVLIGGAMLASSLFGGSVQLSAQGGASATSVLSN